MTSPWASTRSDPADREPDHSTTRLRPLRGLAPGLAAGAVAGVLAVWRADRRRRQAAAAAAEVERLAEVAELERSRAQLQAEAQRAQQLEEIESQRRAMLRSVSHDLRTPLATIRAVTSDLRAGAPYDEETRNELLDTVADEAERLDRLVANLLSLSRIEAGVLKPDRQAVDVDELVRDRVRSLGRLFRQVRIVVDVPHDLPLVDGDYSQLDQLVSNLLENAARHAPPRSTVTISARQAGDSTVEVSVSDEGVGVPQPEIQHIFEPFRRGDGSRSSGIGLAICRAVAEAHGGRIWVNRTPGGGATFTSSLPVRK